MPKKQLTKKSPCEDWSQSYGNTWDDSPQGAELYDGFIAAAHAGCFAMQLSHFLAENSTPPDRLDVQAAVELIPGTGITGSALTLKASVPGIEAAKFQELASKAKDACLVSKALGVISLSMKATLS